MRFALLAMLALAASLPLATNCLAEPLITGNSDNSGDSEEWRASDRLVGSRKLGAILPRLARVAAVAHKLLDALVVLERSSSSINGIASVEKKPAPGESLTSKQQQAIALTSPPVAVIGRRRPAASSTVAAIGQRPHQVTVSPLLLSRPSQSAMAHLNQLQRPDNEESGAVADMSWMKPLAGILLSSALNSAKMAASNGMTKPTQNEEQPNMKNWQDILSTLISIASNASHGRQTV